VAVHQDVAQPNAHDMGRNVSRECIGAIQFDTFANIDDHLPDSIMGRCAPVDRAGWLR
jgi:hypothetical protein